VTHRLLDVEGQGDYEQRVDRVRVLGDEQLVTPVAVSLEEKAANCDQLKGNYNLISLWNRYSFNLETHHRDDDKIHEDKSRRDDCVPEDDVIFKLSGEEQLGPVGAEGRGQDVEVAEVRVQLLVVRGEDVVPQLLQAVGGGAQLC
jgi:hypothetical protein